MLAALIWDCGAEMDVRQNPTNPCSLEKKEGDGSWEQFADLSLCGGGGLPDIELTIDGTIVINGQQPPTILEDFDPRINHTRRVRSGTNEEIRCLAAGNAANVFLRLHNRVKDEISDPNSAIFGLGAVAILAVALGFAFFASWGTLAVILAPAVGAIAVVLTLPKGAFTPQTFREFACILWNNSTEQEGVVYFDYTDVLAAVAAKRAAFNFNIWNAIYYYLELVGENGLNMAADTTAVNDPCCDYCSTDVKTSTLVLTPDVGYYGMQGYKRAANNNLVQELPTGIRIAANGSTVYGGFQWAFNLPEGTELVSLYFRIGNAGEPFTLTTLVNEVTAGTWSNYRPFGNMNYSFDITKLNVGLNVLRAAFYNNNTTTGHFTIEQVWATYRGCDPFRDYRD